MEPSVTVSTAAATTTNDATTASTADTMANRAGLARTSSSIGGGLLGSSGYGGLGSSYGGLGGMGMGMGLGMGMGGMYGGLGSGMGLRSMGGMPGQPGQQGPGGFRQDYQNFFNGLRNLFQILYSGLGLFSFGKLFGSMVVSMVKNILKKLAASGKWIIGALFMNRISAKIINGAVQRASSVADSPQAASNIFVKALFAVAILGTSALWFLQREDSLAERERILKAQVELRRREAELKRLEEIEKMKEAQRRFGVMGETAVSQELGMFPQVLPPTQQQEVILENVFSDAIKIETAREETMDDPEKQAELEKTMKEAEEIVRAHQLELKIQEAESSDSECDPAAEPHGASQPKNSEPEFDEISDKPKNVEEAHVQQPSTSVVVQTGTVKTKKRRLTRNQLRKSQISKNGKAIEAELKAADLEHSSVVPIREGRIAKKAQISEELGNNHIKREIQASENGNSLQKLFSGTFGQPISLFPTASDEDKKRWMLRLSSMPVLPTETSESVPIPATHSESEIPETPVLSHSVSENSSLTQVLADTDSPVRSVEANLDLATSSFSAAGFQRKKKPWE